MGKKQVIIILSVLIFLNATSLYISRNVGTFNLISYAVRIFVYVYVVYYAININYPILLKKNYYYRFCVIVSIYLILNMALTYLLKGRTTALTIPFPTLFALADNCVFLYIGYSASHKNNYHEKLVNSLWWYAVISISVMTFLSIQIRLTYGELVDMWELVRQREVDSLGVMLNAYKNSFPYKFAFFIPFLFMRKSKYNIYLSILCVVNILFVGKKGPLVALVVAALIVFLLSKGRKKKYIVYGSYAVLLFIVYSTFIDDSVWSTLEYRLDPTRHYNSGANASFYMSGRDQIWRLTFEGFLKSNFLELLFGHGTLGVVDWLVPQGAPGNAHNSWLEVLYNFGFVGFCAYFSYFCFLFNMAFKMRRDNYQYVQIFIFVLVMQFITSMVSSDIYGGFGSMCYRGLLVAFMVGNYLLRDKLLVNRQY